MKYREKEFLEELQHYIEGTYSQHYASDKIQTLDVLMPVVMLKHFVEVTF